MGRGSSSSVWEVGGMVYVAYYSICRGWCILDLEGLVLWFTAHGDSGREGMGRGAVSQGRGVRGGGKMGWWDDGGDWGNGDGWRGGMLEEW